MKSFFILIIFFIIASCSNNASKIDNSIFPDFLPLYVDSTVYFNIEKINGKSLYRFNSYTNRDSFYISNINFGKGEIIKTDDIIYISTIRKNPKHNVQNIELFNFKMKKGESKECFMHANNKKYKYELLLRDISIEKLDSIYWFQMKNNIIISCEISNYIVSRKKGILSVFESTSFYNEKVMGINIIGTIPRAFEEQIIKPKGIIN